MGARGKVPLGARVGEGIGLPDSLGVEGQGVRGWGEAGG